MLEVSSEATEEATPAVDHAAMVDDDIVIRNLNGQKLGRKGKITRARILAAATELATQDTGTPISLSAVARKASLGMTSLYLYFNDLTELLIAVLEPILATAEEAYIARMRTRWPDETLAEHCNEFVAAYHAFWQKHTRLLHLRNNMSDHNDKRMMQQRVEFARPVIRLLVTQMDVDEKDFESQAFAMASMLMTALERSVTVWTDRELHDLLDDPAFNNSSRFIQPAGRLIELGIRDARAMVKKAEQA